MLACSGLSWTQFSLLRSAHWDLSQTRPVCVPRLSQESVLTFHTLSLSLVSLSHAFCFGLRLGLLLSSRGSCGAPPSAHHLESERRSPALPPPHLSPGRNKPPLAKGDFSDSSGSPQYSLCCGRELEPTCEHVGKG